jgi:hypothetical protein
MSEVKRKTDAVIGSRSERLSALLGRLSEAASQPRPVAESMSPATPGSDVSAVEPNVGGRIRAQREKEQAAKIAQVATPATPATPNLKAALQLLLAEMRKAGVQTVTLDSAGHASYEKVVTIVGTYQA